MKMQNQLLASGDAKVVGIHVKKGDTVLGDQVLIDMEIIPH
jgi:biotin carboxyl carrier protein